jgi:integrase/recombinase XerC
MASTGEINLTTGVGAGAGDLRTLRQSFLLSLRAEELAATSITAYMNGVDQLIARLLERGMPTNAASIRREHVEHYIVRLQDSGRSRSTVKLRHIGLKKLFKWLLEEGEIATDPMANLRTPRVGPAKPVPILTRDQVKDLLATCSGKKFEDVRDAAILRLLYDSGMRRGELISMTAASIDWNEGEVEIMGKGQRVRRVAVLAKTEKALDRYRRARAKFVEANPHLDSDAFWLGRQGAFKKEGLYAMVKRRGRKAGVEVHPHQLRHTRAHESLASDMNEGDLCENMGWTTRMMVDRYASETRGERARAAHRKLADDL